jgi:hypothetical protein
MRSNNVVVKIKPVRFDLQPVCALLDHGGRTH